MMRPLASALKVSLPSCEAGGGERVAVFIKHPDGLAVGRAFREGGEPALADQGAGGNLAADEIHQPRAGTC